LRCASRDRSRWLHDACNPESARKAYAGCSERYVRERVEAARRWRDASPLGKLDIRIADLKAHMGLLGLGLQYGDREACAADLKRLVARVTELEAERAALAVAVG
jgi:hypothetical protein